MSDGADRVRGGEEDGPAGSTTGPTPPDVAPLAPADVAALTEATSAGGVVLFPAEGVYGLAADPRRPDAVARMAALKSRDPAKPSALMLWSLPAALAAVGGAGEVVAEALRRLLPGPVGVLVPGGDGPFAAVCGPDGTLGVRVPRLPAPVEAPPVLQTSANLAGDPDALEVGDVPAEIRAGCALVLDRGPRSGRPSTLVDLRGLAGPRPTWRIVRVGAVPVSAVDAALDGLGRRAD
jgi:L-threonylcarbamoyladenylate synthase